jgi:SAM-dependent methyltransferase
MATEALIRGVLDLLNDLPSDGRQALDVSCKKGEILTVLRQRGFAVRGTNFAADAPDVAGIPVERGVDILKGLPFPDATFDVVLLTEVIEHLENHRAAVGEIARVVKPGGVAVVTTPNVMRLNSRLHFLLTGFHKTKRRFVRFDTPVERAHEFHAYPIELPILYYLLHQNGLDIERLGASRVKAISWILWPLLWPIVVLYTGFHLYFREKDPKQRAGNMRLFRWLVHPRTLLEDNLILRLRKRRSVAVPASETIQLRRSGVAT